MNQLTPSEIVHQAIQTHRTDGRTSLNNADILYVYGSYEEFKAILADMEDTMGLTLDIDPDIGEMTLGSLLALVNQRVDQAAAL